MGPMTIDTEALKSILQPAKMYTKYTLPKAYFVAEGAEKPFPSFTTPEFKRPEKRDYERFSGVLTDEHIERVFADIVEEFGHDWSQNDFGFGPTFYMQGSPICIMGQVFYRLGVKQEEFQGAHATASGSGFMGNGYKGTFSGISEHLGIKITARQQAAFDDAMHRNDRGDSWGDIAHDIGRFLHSTDDKPVPNFDLKTQAATAALASETFATMAASMTEMLDAISEALKPVTKVSYPSGLDADEFMEVNSMLEAINAEYSVKELVSV